VRDGLFCAHPLVRALLGGTAGAEAGCDAPDGTAVRVSFGAGTPDEHIDRFLTAVGALVRHGARWKYRTVDGRCVPEPA
jgi:selenocysteine lyase/cysteine desulfurase